MKVDEKGVEAATEAVVRFGTHSRLRASALAKEAILAYLSAMSAEPVASDIGEEEIARAMEQRRRELIDQPLARIWPDLVRVALALLQPALERARREERERAAEIADFAAEREDALAFEYDDDVHVAECRGAERAANAIAAAIRKGSGE